MSVCPLGCMSVGVYMCACMCNFLSPTSSSPSIYKIFLTYIKNKKKKIKILTFHECTYVKIFILFYRVVSWDSFPLKKK